LKVQKNECSSPWGISDIHNRVFVIGFGSRAANLWPQADRSSQDFESRSETRPGGKFTFKDP